LVSTVDLPVDTDSLPLHIVGIEPPATERAVAELVGAAPELQQVYGGWMASLHPRAWKEIEAMVRKTGRSLKIDLEPAIEAMGLDRIIEQVGARRVIEEIGTRRFIEEIGVGDFFANLSPTERRELKRLLQKA
jgi:hypothetical protein